MAEAILTISSKNYSSWSLRGWLLCRMAGLDFVEQAVPVDDPANRAELLLLSPSILVPCLTHDGIRVWDTLAIAEYLNEVKPKAGLLPAKRAARARCRSICGEMHSGFSNLRSALPMNLKARHPGFKVWSGAQADIDRIATIWRECFAEHGGPYLFGNLTMADAMYAPGRDPLSDLRRKARPRLRRLLRAHHGVARHDRLARGRADRARRARRTRHGVLSATCR